MSNGVDDVSLTDCLKSCVCCQATSPWPPDRRAVKVKLVSPCSSVTVSMLGPPEMEHNHYMYSCSSYTKQEIQGYHSDLSPVSIFNINGLPHLKTNNLHMRKQRCRSALR